MDGWTGDWYKPIPFEGYAGSESDFNRAMPKRTVKIDRARGGFYTESVT